MNVWDVVMGDDPVDTLAQRVSAERARHERVLKQLVGQPYNRLFAEKKRHAMELGIILTQAFDEDELEAMLRKVKVQGEVQQF